MITMKAHIVLDHYMKFALVCIRRGLFTEDLIFGILRYAHIKFST